jgi:hypothetical protein
MRLIQNTSKNFQQRRRELKNAPLTAALVLKGESRYEAKRKSIMRKYRFLFCIILLIGIDSASFINAQDTIDLAKFPSLNKSLNDLVTLVESKKYTLLKKYAGNKSKIQWSTCGPNDDYPSLYERDAMIKMLTQDSIGARPKVYKEPRVIETIRGGKTYWTVLFTQGWLAPNAYRGFSFSYSVKDKRWNLWRVCHDNEPIYDELTGSR